MSVIDPSSGFSPYAPISWIQKTYGPFYSFWLILVHKLLQGLKTSPNFFALLMNKVLHGPTSKLALCYLDDILVVSEASDQHLEDLAEAF